MGTVLTDFVSARFACWRTCRHPKPEMFWTQYAADRYNLLLRGAGDEGNREAEERVENEELGSYRGRDATKYLVFLPPADAGLGNHMSGMMSAFALSVSTGRVFLHAWTRPTAQ